MRRVSVIGSPGAGKSTFSARLADVLGAEHIEIDSIFHQPNWGQLATPEFQARVAKRLHGSWVADGNYRAVQHLVWAGADTIVWLDLPQYVRAYQLVTRTLARCIWGTELWNGNREEWRNVFSTDPKRSVLAFAWYNENPLRERYEKVEADPLPGVQFVRLTSREEIEQFITAAAETRGQSAMETRETNAREMETQESEKQESKRECESEATGQH